MVKIKNIHASKGAMDRERGGTIPQKERPLLTESPRGAMSCIAAEDLSQSLGCGEEEELETSRVLVRERHSHSTERLRCAAAR